MTIPRPRCLWSSGRWRKGLRRSPFIPLLQAFTKRLPCVPERRCRSESNQALPLAYAWRLRKTDGRSVASSGAVFWLFGPPTYTGTRNRRINRALPIPLESKLHQTVRLLPAADSTGRCNTLGPAWAEGVLQMKKRPRICYTESQRALMWERWRQGATLHQIARLFDRPHTSIRGVLAQTGGVRPPAPKRSRLVNVEVNLTHLSPECRSKSDPPGLSLRWSFVEGEVRNERSTRLVFTALLWLSWPSALPCVCP